MNVPRHVLRATAKSLIRPDRLITSLTRKRRTPIGAMPGTLMVDALSPKPALGLMRFDRDGVEERPIASVDELASLRQPGKVAWIDVVGLGDEAVLRTIGATFGIHPLALEDIVNVPQRPKMEIYQGFQFIVARQLRMVDTGAVDIEQVSIVVGDCYVVTFQERWGDVFEPVRQRLREGSGRLRASGAGYLAYALLDAIVDAFYPVLEGVGDQLEELEFDVLARSDRRTLQRLSVMKGQLLHVRRAIWPLRDAVNTLVRDDSPYIADDVRVYLRDTHDHCVSTADVIESYRELLNGLLNTYLSVVSNRTNDVMKVLTMMASIFIPLTFMAGIYGMNFEYMPELHERWGYPALLAAMLVVALGMVYFFYRKGWLGGRSRDD
jgi:magnesium transporter